MENIEEKSCLVYLRATQTRNAQGQLVAEVGAVIFGEKGYTKTTYGLQTEKWVDERNKILGFSRAESVSMVTCSMFGRWGSFHTMVKESRLKD